METGDGRSSAEGPGDTVAATAKFQAAFEHALDAILIGVGPIFTDANPAACALIGLPREQIVGRAFHEFHRPRDQHEVERLFGTLITEGAVRGDIDIVRGDGFIRHVEFAATADILPGVHLSVLRDITARKQREEMSQRYELLSRHARDVVLFIDKTGRIVEANDAAVSVYGYGREELLGMNIRALRAEETRDQVAAQMEEAFARGILFETVHRRRDGATFPVEIGSRAAMIGGELMLLSIVRDLSERAEMKANLLHADRLAAVGTLAAGVAHEINNPLAYAMGNLDMLARRLPDVVARLGAEAAAPPDAGTPGRLATLAAELDEAREMLAVAREGAARVRTIVLDLRRFSRPDEALVGPVDVHEVLEYAIGMAVADIRHRARMVRAYGAVPCVVVNESRLGQVFLNLLVNAAQAIPEGRAPEHEIRVCTGTDSRGRVVIEVVDTGVGIPLHLLGRVFDPFLTTKPVGEGTGLGLFVSRSIVKDAGGEITVESEVGRGTTVRVVLPPAKSNLTPPIGLSTVPRTPPAPRARLLVIDDEPALATLVRSLLTGEHDVVVAQSGREALALLLLDARFDVVLCDLMMPDLSGLDLLDLVGRTHPDLAPRFVFMTGAFTPRVEEVLARFPGRTLRKPFDPEALRALIARLPPRAR